MRFFSKVFPIGVDVDGDAEDFGALKWGRCRCDKGSVQESLKTSEKDMLPGLPNVSLKSIRTLRAERIFAIDWNPI